MVVPTIAGKRGNPVVWSRRFFADLSRLDGDVGARHLIGSYPEAVVEVPVTGRAALRRRRHARRAARRQGRDRRAASRQSRLASSDSCATDRYSRSPASPTSNHCRLASDLRSGRGLMTRVLRALAVRGCRHLHLGSAASRPGRRRARWRSAPARPTATRIDYRDAGCGAQRRARQLLGRRLQGRDDAQAQLRRVRDRRPPAVRPARLRVGAPASARPRTSRCRSCYQYGGKDCVIRAFACDVKG